MKNKLTYVLSILGIAVMSAFMNQVSAQSNILPEVNVKPNDGFGELRNLIAQNFDFTNPNYSEGVIDSVVKFQVEKDGKLKNVEVDGECKYVSAEIKDIVTHLQTQFTALKNTDTVYAMPVTMMIASK